MRLRAINWRWPLTWAGDVLVAALIIVFVSIASSFLGSIAQWLHGG